MPSRVEAPGVGIPSALQQINLMISLIDAEKNRKQQFLSNIIAQGNQLFEQRRAEGKAERAQSRADKKTRLGAGLALGGAAVGAGIGAGLAGGAAGGLTATQGGLIGAQLGSGIGAGFGGGGAGSVIQGIQGATSIFQQQQAANQAQSFATQQTALSLPAGHGTIATGIQNSGVDLPLPKTLGNAPGVPISLGSTLPVTPSGQSGGTLPVTGQGEIPEELIQKLLLALQQAQSSGGIV